MRYTITITIQLFAILFSANAQTNAICAVKYKDLKTTVILGTHNYWFNQDKLISIDEPNNRNIFMKGFGVLINGVMTTQSDTVKYNKEFNEWVNDLNNMKKKSVNTSMKDYNSDITKMAIFVVDNKTNYVVVDTLAKMDSWEITNEIETFMGYKCQKAIVNYKQEKYTALFTTQLPYNAGPDVFRGLPGLILKVSNTNSTLGYEAIEILTPYKGLVPTFNNDGLSVSRKEWVVIINEINKKAREARANMLKQYKKNAEAQNQ